MAFSIFDLHASVDQKNFPDFNIYNLATHSGFWTFSPSPWNKLKDNNFGKTFIERAFVIFLKPKLCPITSKLLYFFLHIYCQIWSDIFQNSKTRAFQITVLLLKSILQENFKLGDWIFQTHVFPNSTGDHIIRIAHFRFIIL